jgi:archaetidylinositol phosphate synthase
LVLNNFRSRAERALAPLVDRLATGPRAADRLTWASLAVAALAAAAFAAASPDRAWLLPAGAGLVFLTATLDGLDGMVARKTGSASPAGDFLDHVIDRYSDMLLLGGLALSPFGDMLWGLLAVTGVFLTSYLGTQSAAVGLGRDYGGWLGRADRLVLLVAVPLVQFAAVAAGAPLWYAWPLPEGALPAPIAPNITLVGLLLLFLGVAGHLTALQRFRRARKALAARMTDAVSAPDNP